MAKKTIAKAKKTVKTAKNTKKSTAKKSIGKKKSVTDEQNERANLFYKAEKFADLVGNILKKRKSLNDFIQNNPEEFGKIVGESIFKKMKSTEVDMISKHVHAIIALGTKFTSGEIEQIPQEFFNDWTTDEMKVLVKSFIKISEFLTVFKIPKGVNLSKGNKTGLNMLVSGALPKWYNPEELITIPETGKKVKAKELPIRVVINLKTNKNG